MSVCVGCLVSVASLYCVYFWYAFVNDYWVDRRCVDESKYCAIRLC